MKPLKYIQQEKGYALVMTILSLLLVSVVGVSLMTLSLNTNKITKNERDNQSSYYIAEAGIVEKRAQINEIARQVYVGLKNEYDSISDPAIKKDFNLEQRFYEQAKERIETFVASDTTSKYSPQFGGEPESRVTVEPDLNRPLTYTIKSVGRVPVDNENWKEKVVTQSIEITMNLVSTSTTTATITSSTPVQKLNACYAVYTQAPINYAGGTVYGDMYSDQDIEISNGSIQGSVFSKGSIVTNRDIAGSVVAEKSLKINGGQVTKDAIGKNVEITNGTIKGNLVAMEGLAVKGGTIDLNAVSHKNLTIQNYPDIKQNAIAMDNIYVNQDWFSISGKYIYGNEVYFINSNNNSNIPSKKEKRNDMSTVLAKYPTLDSILAQGGGCLTKIPSLPDVSTAFPTPTLTVPANQTIQVGGNQHDVIKDGTLNINSWIVRDSDFKLVMEKDMYFRDINFSENYTLKIDLKNQDRKIYVDRFNNSQGHIELLNPGKLEIIVQNSFSSKGILNNNGDSNAFTIRYAGNNSVTLSGESLINGSFHIKNAPMLTVNANGIRGDLIVYGNTAINISGGSSVSDRLILAPNAALSITGGGQVKGNIIAKSLYMDGGATVTPPSRDYGEWEVPGTPAETIELPVYGEGENFLKIDPLEQES